jgi:RIO kinase 1
VLIVIPSALFDDSERYEAWEVWAETRNAPHTRRDDRKSRQQTARAAVSADPWPEPDIVTSPDGGLVTSYTPSRHEEGWLEHALRPFFENELITDVLSLARGGKEANVYLCEAHPSVGVPWLAAKVYRPKIFRTIRNDALYREGRATISASGKEVRARDKRAMKAIGHKSNFGNFLAHQSWMMHELQMLEQLSADGLAVPKPYGKSDNAILMAWIGDRQAAAPTLQSVTLSALHNGAEIYRLFHQVLEVITRMLAGGHIHGDLSAWNILYWQGELVVIDFPQTVAAHRNSEGYHLLLRDVQRVCDYFSRHGVRARPHAITDALWHMHIAPDATNRSADLSRLTDPFDLA